jgi:hypothetical protein
VSANEAFFLLSSQKPNEGFFDFVSAPDRKRSEKQARGHSAQNDNWYSDQKSARITSLKMTTRGRTSESRQS